MVNSKEIVIGLAAVDSVRKILITPNPEFLLLWQKKDLEAVDKRHPLGQWSAVVTRDSPAVIYDDGADICSPVVTFDQQGNALHAHFNLTGELMGLELTTRFMPEMTFPSTLRKYFDRLPTYLKGESITSYIGGTNLHPGDAQRPGRTNRVDEIIAYVKTTLGSVYPNAELLSLVSRRFEDQQRSSTIVPDGTRMRGFLFIPRYLAKDNRNHILAIAEGEDVRLRSAFGIISNP